MANVTVTAVRPLILGGARVAAGSTASVEVSIARDLVFRGEATATFTDDVASKSPTGALIDYSQIQNVTLGAADSGGTGFKVLRVPN